MAETRGTHPDGRPIRRRPTALRYGQMPPMVAPSVTLPPSRPAAATLPTVDPAGTALPHRTCRTCRQSLPIDRFPVWRDRRRHGRPARVSTCRECERSRQRGIRDRRAAAAGRTRQPRPPSPRPGFHRCPACELTLPRAAFGTKRRTWTRVDGTRLETLARVHRCRPCETARRQAGERRRALRQVRQPACQTRRRVVSRRASDARRDRRHEQRRDQLRWITTVIQRLTLRAERDGWTAFNLAAVSGIGVTTLRHYADPAHARRLIHQIGRTDSPRSGAVTLEPKLVDLLRRLNDGDPETLAILTARRRIHGDPLGLRDRFRSPRARRAAALRDRGV